MAPERASHVLLEQWRGPGEAHYMTKIMRLLAPLSLLLACGQAATPVPKPTPPVVVAHKPEPARVCEEASTRTKPSSMGEAMVVGGDGKPHALHWVKLDAITKPARGTLFYLAGGPLSHAKYTDLAAGFQKAAFPDLDVVLYDYFGFNCSTAIEDMATLRAQVPNLTMPAMAQDFVQLKRALSGDKKVYVMGGSHGALLGAEIVRDYPNEIERAVLFSGDTESGWLEGGWFRFDDLMTKLDVSHPGFAASLTQLLESAAAGDRPTLEVALWMGFSQSSAAQAALPDLVMKAKGEAARVWIAPLYAAALALLETRDGPASVPALPTDESLVTNLHRCNVWFPRSERDRSRASAPVTRFFRYESFVGYWNVLCKDYDGLGEYPLHATPKTPVSVPVLTWVGDQDTFDPKGTEAHWSALSSASSFQVMEGWSHDFGPDMRAGFLRVAAAVNHAVK
jgi:pimeloyl-ACP methyl ester carboxylesterase